MYRLDVGGWCLGSHLSHDTTGKESVCVHLHLVLIKMLCFPSAASVFKSLCCPSCPLLPIIAQTNQILPPLLRCHCVEYLVGRLGEKKNRLFTFFKSKIMCLCYSTKSSFPLLADWAAGWRCGHETSRQSCPVSHSTDTTNHTDLQRVGDLTTTYRRMFVH